MMKHPLIIVVFLLVYSCEENTVIDTPLKESGPQLNEIYTALFTEDNGVLIAGEYDSKTTILKTDTNFNTLWKQDSYEWGTNFSTGGWGGESYTVRIVALFQQIHGNYVCIGSVTEGGCVLWSSALIVELDHKGEEIRKFDIQDFAVNDAIQTSDDGYLLMGNKLIKLDNHLSVSWEKEFSDRDYMETKIINTIEGGYAITGRYQDDEVFLKKLDLNGNELWANGISSNKTLFGYAGFDLVQLDDLGFIIFGRTQNTSMPFDLDCYIVRTDFSGDTIWTSKFGGTTDEWLDKCIYSSDSRYIVQGTSGFPNDSIQQTILLETDINRKIFKSCYIKETELLLYNPSGYFLKAVKSEESGIRLSRIPLCDLFNQESDK